MKCLVIVLTCLTLSGTAKAYSEAETNAVASFLITCYATAPEMMDNVTENLENSPVSAFNNYTDLFSFSTPTNHVGYSWTPNEKRCAFEEFVMGIPRLSTQGDFKNLRSLGDIALSYCDRFAPLNALCYATNILVSPKSLCGIAALRIFRKHVQPSDGMTTFVIDVATNRVADGIGELVLSSYAHKLHSERDILPHHVVTNGVRELIQNCYGGYGCRQLDLLLLDIYPTYSVSSNRLNLAERALSHLEGHPHLDEGFIRDYFVPITNALHCASQQLPVVEDL